MLTVTTFIINIVCSQTPTLGDLPTFKGGLTSKGLIKAIVSDSNISVDNTQDLTEQENTESAILPSVFSIPSSKRGKQRYVWSKGIGARLHTAVPLSL